MNQLKNLAAMMAERNGTTHYIPPKVRAGEEPWPPATVEECEEEIEDCEEQIIKIGAQIAMYDAGVLRKEDGETWRGKAQAAYRATVSDRIALELQLDRLRGRFDPAKDREHRTACELALIQARREAAESEHQRKMERIAAVEASNRTRAQAVLTMLEAHFPDAYKAAWRVWEEDVEPVRVALKKTS